MAKPITSQEMSQWVKETWEQAQERARAEAWERCREQLEKPELLEVFKRLKDR